MERVKHPRFNGYVCIVGECERVEYKHQLCRQHWAEVPLQWRLKMMLDAVTAARDAAIAHEPELQKWAENYHQGMIASAWKRG